MQSMDNVWRKRARATACVYLFSLFYSDGWLIKKISLSKAHTVQLTENRTMDKIDFILKFIRCWLSEWRKKQSYQSKSNAREMSNRNKETENNQRSKSKQ